MSIRISETNVFTEADALASQELVDQSYSPGTDEVYSDVNRTDTYVEDGTPSRPFKLLTDAIALANSCATSAKPYRVVAAPGIYDVAPFTLNPYVKLEGSGWQTTILKSTDLTNHFITMSAASVLKDVGVWGPTNAGKAAIVHLDNDTRPASVIEVAISRGYYGILCAPTISRGVMLVQTFAVAYAGNIIQELVHVSDFGDVSVQTGLCSSLTDKVVRGFSVSGTNAKMVAVNCLFEVGGTTDGFFVNDGATLTLLSCQLNKGLNALRVGTDGVSNLIAHNVSILNFAGSGFTKDILIESAAANVHFSGSATRARFDNTVGANLSATFQDVTSGDEGSVILGENRVGSTTSKLLPMLSYGKASFLTGLSSGGEVTRNASPSRVLNVAAGVGYVNDGVDPIQVSWSGSTVTITASSTEYVYVDKNSVIQHNVVQPAYAENIILAQAVASATDIVLLTRDEIEINHSLSRFQEFFEDVIGPLSVSGGIVTASGTALKLNVSTGSFTLGISERDIAGGADVPFYYVSNDGAGGWTYTLSTVIDTVHLDLGAGPVVYPGANHWKKDAWYVVVNSGGEVYYCVYGQVDYADQVSAEAGAFPVVPEILQHYSMRAAGIVSHDGDAAITSVLDVRPMLGQNAPVTAAVAADHDLLLNLDHDGHLHYQTAARALTAHGTYPGAHVTGGDTHDHTGGAGAQIDHTGLSNVGTRTHLQLEADIATRLLATEKAAANGVASLNVGSKVVEDPANATATPTISKIPISDGSGTLNSWVTFGSNYQSAVDVTRTTHTGAGFAPKSPKRSEF